MNPRCQNHILCLIALAFISHVEPGEPNRSHPNGEAKALEHSIGDLNHNQKGSNRMSYPFNRALQNRQKSKNPPSTPEVQTTPNLNTDQLTSKDISSTIITSTNLGVTTNANIKDQSSTSTDEASTLDTNLTKVTWAPQDLSSKQTESFDESSSPTPTSSVQPPVLLENPLEGKFKSEGRWGFRSGNFAPPPPIPPPPPSSLRFPPRPYEPKPRPRPSDIFPEANPYWGFPPWMSPFQSPFPFWPDLDYFDQGPLVPIPAYEAKFPPPQPFLTREEGGPIYERVPPRARFIVKK